MCSLFGLIDYKGCLSAKQKEKIIKALSVECEVRGTDATGVAYVENNNITIYKEPLQAKKMRFNFKSNPKVIMGHTRLTTQGDEKLNFNNHPFYSKKLKFALAHNGVIYNDKKLRVSEKLPETYIQTDTYVAVQLIEKQKALSFDALKFMAEKVEGTFCFTVLDKENNLFIVKGDNPIAIYDFGGFYIYASTEEILNKTLKKLRLKADYKKLSLECGDILKIKADGSFESDKFDSSRLMDKWSYCYPFYSSRFYRGLEEDSTFLVEESDEYLKDLIEYGKSIGVAEEDIRYLLDMGYDYFDIEEMLYESEILEEHLYASEKEEYLFY